MGGGGGGGGGGDIVRYITPACLVKAYGPVA